MLNATFNTISVISWRLVLFVEETGVPALSMFKIMLLQRLNISGFAKTNRKVKDKHIEC